MVSSSCRNELFVGFYLPFHREARREWVSYLALMIWSR